MQLILISVATAAQGWGTYGLSDAARSHLPSSLMVGHVADGNLTESSGPHFFPAHTVPGRELV